MRLSAPYAEDNLHRLLSSTPRRTQQGRGRPHKPLRSSQHFTCDRPGSDQPGARHGPPRPARSRLNSRALKVPPLSKPSLLSIANHVPNAAHCAITRCTQHNGDATIPVFNGHAITAAAKAIPLSLPVAFPALFLDNSLSERDPQPGPPRTLSSSPPSPHPPPMC